MCTTDAMHKAMQKKKHQLLLSSIYARDTQLSEFFFHQLLFAFLIFSFLFLFRASGLCAVITANSIIINFRSISSPSLSVCMCVLQLLRLRLPKSLFYFVWKIIRITWNSDWSFADLVFSNEISFEIRLVEGKVCSFACFRTIPNGPRILILIIDVNAIAMWIDKSARKDMPRPICRCVPVFVINILFRIWHNVTKSILKWNESNPIQSVYRNHVYDFRLKKSINSTSNASASFSLYLSFAFK